MLAFIETKLFTRLVEEFLSDDEYRELQLYLLDLPEAGAVIPGSGGVRKLRWKATGRGKRGGYRTIYFVRSFDEKIWLLTMYVKNEQDNISAKMLNAIRKEIEDETET